MLDKIKHLLRKTRSSSFSNLENIDIKAFRGRFCWDALEKRYYRNLDFIDYDQKPESIRRKKHISQNEAVNGIWYSVCFFDTQGFPVRIDNIGGYMPSETHLIWEVGRLFEVYDFALGFRGKIQVKERPHLINYWSFVYDSSGRLMQNAWLNFADYTYYRHDKMQLLQRFEYDAKGLVKVYKRKFAFHPPSDLPIPDGDEWLSYDREHEELLAKSTVSKAGYISVIRKPKKSVPFSRKYYAISTDTAVPICPTCRLHMDYIGFVDLKDYRIQRKSLLEKIPIFFCFKCLQWETYTFDFKSNSGFEALKVSDLRLFPESDLDFVKSTDEERSKQALFKVGGIPDWIQNEEWPTCPKCKNKMLFVCQISTDETISNGEYSQAFGDSGKLYVFTCCEYVSTYMQCF